MKRNITFVNGSLIPKKAVSLGTAYRVVENSIELVNVVYVPKTNEFGYNYAINLPYPIIKLFNKTPYDVDDAEFMEEIGIQKITKWSEVIEQYKKDNQIYSFNNQEYLNALKALVNKSDLDEEKEVQKRKYIKLI